MEENEKKLLENDSDETGKETSENAQEVIADDILENPEEKTAEYEANLNPEETATQDSGVQPETAVQETSEALSEETTSEKQSIPLEEAGTISWGRRSKKKITITVVCIALAVILALALGILLVVDSYLDKINKVEGPEPTVPQEVIDSILLETDPPEETFEGVSVDPEDVTMPTAPAEQIEKEDHVYNILLIGQDRRPGEGRARSDSMILCTINTEKKTLVMTSFLRDLYVRFPEYNGKKYSDNRLNVPYVIGGMEMLDDCLELNFGVQVDHNVEVDFSGFEKIIDVLGGVGLELTYGESLYVPKAQQGWNHLNGEQALAYARIRKLDSDFGRANRQRKVLLALLAQVKNTDLDTFVKLADNIFPMITTDMTNADILNYLAKIVPILPELQITTQQIPGEDAYYFANVRGMSVIIPNLEKCCEQLKDTIG